MVNNHHAVRADNPCLASFEFLSLYLQHKLREAIPTAYVTQRVLHPFHVRGEVLEQNLRIGIVLGARSSFSFA